MTTATKTQPEPLLIRPDGRTRLAALLAQYDALKDEKDAAQQMLDKAKHDLDELTDQIKKFCPEPKVVLFTDQLRHPVQVDNGTQRRMLQLGLDNFRAEHPELWLQYSTESAVTTLRRLTGLAWLRRFRDR
jgi:hypothetical protein